MFDFTKHVAARLRRAAAGVAGATPQRDPIPGSAQVPNGAGGHAWAVSDWDRLERFLVMGSAGGTFYAGERALTREAAAAVERCLAEDGARVVGRAVAVSAEGRAPSNDPALFVLAMAAGLGDDAARAAALAALPRVARTGTHLFHWLRYVRAFRGWGRGVRRAVGGWYAARTPGELAYQLTKYRARDGWSHRDALRLAHPAPPGPTHAVLYRYAARGWEAAVGGGGAAAARAVAPVDGAAVDVGAVARVAAAHALAGMAPAAAALAIAEHRLVREEVPTALLRHAAVWEALLPHMPVGAMLRNLGVMTRLGLLAPGSDAAAHVAAALTSRAALRRARVHPVAVLSALRTYAGGRGARGRGAWAPVAAVVDALDAAFYLAFANAPSTGRRVLLALDVSGSMAAPVHGLAHLSCREASAAVALATAAAEPRHRFVAFTDGAYPSAHSARGVGSGLTELAVSPRQRLDDVLAAAAALPFGGTDCALPMLAALERGWPVDAFVVYTDSETWAGRVHPAQALRRYRERTGIAAKLVVVAMASNGFTIADPDDAGMLDVVGFDAAVPQVVADFLAGPAGPAGAADPPGGAGRGGRA
jgi:60 kDa SS-A/Ro ribonucleoprotein